MLSAYPACFIKESNGYSVIFPDLNYLSTCGETLDEALAMAVSSIDKINPVKIAEELDVSPKESFVNIITVDVEEYAKVHFEKSVKKTLTIPAWLNTAALEQSFNLISHTAYIHMTACCPPQSLPAAAPLPRTSPPPLLGQRS